MTKAWRFKALLPFGLVLLLWIVCPAVSYAECWREFLGGFYLDLDSVKDTPNGMVYRTKRYDAENRHSSRRTGFFYQRHRVPRGGGNFYEQVQVYDWYSDKYLPWVTTSELTPDKYIELRFLIMELFHREGRTGWPG